LASRARGNFALRVTDLPNDFDNSVGVTRWPDPLTVVARRARPASRLTCAGGTAKACCGRVNTFSKACCGRVNTFHGHGRARGAPGMGRGGFDLSIAELGRQRVEIIRAASADHLDGLPLRRTTSLVYLSRLFRRSILWASSCGSLRCWRTVRVSALLRLGL
jgi:hypothetical protein